MGDSLLGESVSRLGLIPVAAASPEQGSKLGAPLLLWLPLRILYRDTFATRGLPQYPRLTAPNKRCNTDTDCTKDEKQDRRHPTRNESVARAVGISH